MAGRDVRELDATEIKKLTDPAVLQAQAHLNTRALGSLRRERDDLSVDDLRANLQEELKELDSKIQSTPADDPDLENLVKRKLDIDSFLEKLNDPERADETWVQYQENLSKAIEGRQRRQGFLIRRRQELQREKIQQESDERERQKREIPRRLWGEKLEERRKELLGLLNQYESDIRESLDRFGADHGIQKTMMHALLRHTSGCIELLKRVPLKLKDDL